MTEPEKPYEKLERLKWERKRDGCRIKRWQLISGSDRPVCRLIDDYCNMENCPMRYWGM